MYFYIYDTYLNDRKYEKILDKIKTRLLDLDIQGKHEKMTLLKNIDELVEDEVRRGVNTVIVVGNDKTFLKVVDVAAKNNVIVGLIPVGPGNEIALSLGIKPEDLACDIIAARKVSQFDLGQVNANYFFSSIKLTKNLDRLTVVKDNFKIIPKANCSLVAISSFHVGSGGQLAEKVKDCSCQDGFLELVISKTLKKGGWFGAKTKQEVVDSVISSRQFEVKSFEYLPAVVDEYRIIKTPFKVEIGNKKLSIIVGKDRMSLIK